MTSKFHPKRILMTIDSLGRGGAEKVLLTLSRALIELGHQVTIISIKNCVDYEVDFPVKIETINFEKKRFQSTYAKYARILANKIVRLEREQGCFDLIVSHLQMSHRLMAKTKIPLVYYCIHSALSPGSLGQRTGLRLFLKRRKLSKIFNNKDIITISKSMKTDLLDVVKVKPRSVQTIYNAVDFDGLKQLAAQKNPYSNTDYIVHVGRLEKIKRHDILLRAYLKAQITAKLLILGEGPQRAAIEEDVMRLGLTDRVIFTGFLHNPYPIIRDARLCVLTSDYEGLPTVLIESLGLGTVVVSTDCPTGPQEILVGPLADYLAPVADIDALATKINNALYDQSQHKIDFTKIQLERFNAKQVAQQYLALANRSDYR